jgi:site-specific recombinase XerD
MVSAFISTRRLRNLSPKTKIFSSQHLNKFLEFMESRFIDVSVEKIGYTILREYVSGLKESHSPGGVNHYIKVLKILFKFMIEEGVITENPSRKISKLNVERVVISTFPSRLGYKIYGLSCPLR